MERFLTSVIEAAGEAYRSLETYSVTLTSH